LLNLIQNQSGDFVITIELLLDSDETHRSRLVDTISVEDLPCLTRDGEYSEDAAQLAFSDSLSPNETATLELARALHLRPNRYRPEFGLGTDVQTAGSALGHLAGVSWLYNLYPEFRDTLEELAQREAVPVCDVLSSLTPRSFAEHFMLPSQCWNELEWCWVITEDGVLKLCPFNIDSGNLRKLLVRVAHGRNVLASGTAMMRGHRIVDVYLNSEDYQHGLGGLAPQTAGLSELGDLHEFVAIVFELQAGLLASSVGYRDTLWTDGRSATRLREWQLYQDLFDDLNGVFAPIFEMDGTGSSQETTGEQTPIPMQSYLDWMRTHPGGSLRAWAKAVLGVTNDTSKRDIKASYFKLAMVYHPDTGGSKEAFGTLNQAYAVMNGSV
jgi:hypothetical protein